LPQPARRSSKPTVFISYSHKDEKWKNRLLAHLQVLQREGYLEVWEDRQIAAGEEWLPEIRSALERARVAVLLISADFLNSNFIRNEEVRLLLERRKTGEMRVIPVILRSCPWESVLSVSSLQARPRDGKPLARFKGDDVDRELKAIALEIQKLLDAKAIEEADDLLPGTPSSRFRSWEPVRILILSANSESSVPLKLEEEAQEIERALGEVRGRFQVFRYPAVRPTELQRCLLEHRPHIVHFSGHGDIQGIRLQGENGQFQVVSGELLERLFEHFQCDLRCVVLNACYSSRQARSIARVIDCVIGMSAPITDYAAIRFTEAFYQALAFGRDVEAAFELGRLQIDLADLEGGEAPQLIAERCEPAKVRFSSASQISETDTEVAKVELRTKLEVEVKKN
jgi:hypothetical protein